MTYKMTGSLKQLVLLIISFITLTAATAQEYEGLTRTSYDIFYYKGMSFDIISDTEVELYGIHDKDIIHLDIPSVAIDERRKESYGYREKAYKVTSIRGASSSKIKTVSIPNSVVTIHDLAFYSCESLESVIIPNSVTSIGREAFYKCTNLKSAFISNSVTSIEERAFYGCENLISVSLPNSITKIENETFYGCKSLPYVSIPNSVTSIEEYAFSGCLNLAMISLSNSLDSIGDWAFNHCKFSSITIPRSVTYIGDRVCGNCRNISKIYCYAITPPKIIEGSITRTIKYSSISGISYPGIILYVPKEALNDYKSHEEWGRYQSYPFMTLSPEAGYNISKYDNYNVKTKGVTADGLSKLSVSNMLDFVKDEEPPIFSNVKVIFEVDGEEVTDEAITGTVSDIGWLDVNVWGGIYTAPKEFPQIKEGNEYDVSLTFTEEKDGLVGVIGGAQIKVYRPGVMLVHGLSSNAGCFKYLYNYLQQFGGYEDFQLLKVNYKSSNKATFENNTYRYRVIENNAEQLYNKLADKGIVSSAYDIVGHSMGGILARKYAQEIDQKSVNRIITMNTPHSGSPLAKIYEEVVPVLAVIVSKVGFWPKLIVNGLTLLANYSERWGNWGAIQDLSPNSRAINQLNKKEMLNKAEGIPVHASCSTIKIDKAESDNSFLTDESSKWYSLTSVKYFFGKVKEKIPSGIDVLNSVFMNDSHDGIVSFISQRGGLKGQPMSLYQDDYKGIFGSKSNAFHTNNTDHPESLTLINKLLHESKTSESFAKGFKPEDLSKTSARRKAEIETADFKEPSESQFIKIEAEKEDTARIVKVTVTGSDDLWSNMVFFGLDEETLMSSIGQSEYRFQIPDIFEGDLIIYALGRTNDDALVGDTAVVSFKSAASLTYMYFEDWPSVTMTEGQQLEFNVLAGWTNGEEKYITPNYSTDKSGIIDIEGALITAKGVGECQLFAQYGDLSDTLNVKVIPAIPSNIQTVRVDKPTVKYYNGILTVIANKAVSGNLSVEIYDLSGRPYLRKHQNVSLKEGERAAFDLSSLPSQLYIVKVSGAVDATLKFYKR